jgi:glycosyltransferase involved in cell wall biosynthesis
MNPRLCLVSSYPPRECGIATFTRDLRQAIGASPGYAEASVVAMTNTPEGYDYPPEVVFGIRQEEAGDYRLAADYVNLSGFDLVCLQHEFGIFGGPNGQYITEMMERLRMPVVTVLHTVLAETTSGYRESLVRVAALSDHLVVLSERSIPILKDVYGVPEEKIRLIPHGVPETSFIDPNYYKDKLAAEGKLVILTFGLLSRNKGIEMVLDALPDVVRAHPEVVYVVLGATHPEVKRRHGEEYRVWLQKRVEELGLTEHVVFDRRYLEQAELVEMIGACDIYVTPYRSKEQIVSGTLAYAVGMGKAVVSTPYLYAEELLADGRGLLVDFGDARGLTEKLLGLIDDPAARHRMRKRAYQYGRQMIWPEVGKRYVDLFDVAARQGCKRAPRPARSLSAVRYTLPGIKLDHLARLTDDTGIIQHAAYGVPNRRFGYSTDDAARGLVVALMHHDQHADDLSLRLIDNYLSFLQYQQLPDGDFHNFLSYSRQPLDERGSEDTLGRALWGLGAAVAYGPTTAIRSLACEMFEAALGALDFQHARAMAYAICGLHSFLQRYGGATAARRRLTGLAGQLAGCFNAESDGWQWFGDELTYGNAKMPHAMLLAFEATGEERFRDIGLKSLDFLLGETYRRDHFDFVGNQGWYRRSVSETGRGSEAIPRASRAIFSQQPIEAGYTAEACLKAYEITGSARYFDMARAAAEWLLGRNRLNVRLYDSSTGACADGLDPHGPSMNQGAESAICALLALLAVSKQVEKDNRERLPVEARISKAATAEAAR